MKHAQFAAKPFIFSVLPDSSHYLACANINLTSGSSTSINVERKNQGASKTGQK